MEIKDILLSPFKRVFQSAFKQVHDINQRYAVPHIKMSNWVRICLLSLRVYLIILVGLLFFKFFSSLQK